MDFELSDQQRAFRDLMRDFARKSIAPVARDWELAGRYPEEIVEEMKAMGLFGMLVPEEYGGIAIDAVSYSVVFEEISKAWMGVAGIPGLAVGKALDKRGYKRPGWSGVFFSGCRVPAKTRLGGEEGHGLQRALPALEFGRVNIAGRAVGVAQAGLDRPLAYAHDRHAF